MVTRTITKSSSSRCGLSASMSLLLLVVSLLVMLDGNGCFALQYNDYVNKLNHFKNSLNNVKNQLNNHHSQYSTNLSQRKHAKHQAINNMLNNLNNLLNSYDTCTNQCQSTRGQILNRIADTQRQMENDMSQLKDEFVRKYQEEDTKLAAWQDQAQRDEEQMQEDDSLTASEQLSLEGQFTLVLGDYEETRTNVQESYIDPLQAVYDATLCFELQDNDGVDDLTSIMSIDSVGDVEESVGASIEVLITDADDVAGNVRQVVVEHQEIVTAPSTRRLLRNRSLQSSSSSSRNKVLIRLLLSLDNNPIDEPIGDPWRRRRQLQTVSWSAELLDLVLIAFQYHAVELEPATQIQVVDCDSF